MCICVWWDCALSTGTKKIHILIAFSLGKILWCESKALLLQTVQHHLVNIVRLIGNGKESQLCGSKSISHTKYHPIQYILLHRSIRSISKQHLNMPDLTTEIVGINFVYRRMTISFRLECSLRFGGEFGRCIA